MHTIQINDDTYTLPQSWDELTLAQLRHLVKLTQSDIPVEEIKIHMMLYCLDAHVGRHKDIFHDKVHLVIGQQSEKINFRVRKNSYMLTPEEISLLADLFHYLIHLDESKYGSDFDHYYINPELNANPLPTLRCRLRKFTGPDDQLLDITFEQYMYIQAYLDSMKSTPEHIDYLLACLWHSGKKFDINRLDRDASILHYLPSDIKMVLYWFILGSLNLIAANYPRVFSGTSGGNGRVFDSQMRLLDSLAQSDMTKKPEVRKGYLIDALYSMDESLRRGEEANSEINK